MLFLPILNPYRDKTISALKDGAIVNPLVPLVPQVPQVPPHHRNPGTNPETLPLDKNSGTNPETLKRTPNHKPRTPNPKPQTSQFLLHLHQISPKMKTIGIVGGLGPEATVDYYKEIINCFKTGGGEMNYPEIIIYSVNMADFLAPMKRKAWDDAAGYLLDKIRALKNAGADFAAISANTPHLLFEKIKADSPLPLISIVEATREEASKRGLKNPGLIGTGFTMNASFYPDTFSKYGMNVVMPGDEDKKLINHRLFTEIELGIFKDETRQELIDITRKMVEEKHIDSMILGCTEFPLILPDAEYAGIPMLNTTRIHVEAIVREARRA